MRGNESPGEGPPSQPTLPFPIPMRGNEHQRLAGTIMVLLWFPIPMRGNEIKIDGGVQGPQGPGFQSP